MLATVLHLPKWLLAAVALCIATGHLQQLECKYSGCTSIACDAGTKSGTQGESAQDHAGGDCHCSCHLGVSVLAETTLAGRPPLAGREVKPCERTAQAPEAPCAKIEYPPRALGA